MTTIPDGDDIREYFAHLGVSGSAWIAAVGTVEGAELTVSGAAGEVTQAVPGPATLVSLLGPPQGPLMAVLTTAEAGVVAGRLTRGVSAGVGFTVLEAAAPAPVPALVPPVASRSGLPAASTFRAARLDDEEADELPLQGDRIDHFVFGLCDVMVVQGERFKIRALGDGKLREIHVGPFRLSKPVTKDGKRVFKLVKRS